MTTASLPPLPVSVVGSWPRPPGLLSARRLARAGRMPESDLERIADRAVLEALRAQEDAGVDVVTDGEQRRDNFYSFVAGKLSGVRLLTLAELLDHVEDRAGFERILQTLDVPASAVGNPTCVGRLDRREPLAVGELRFLKAHARRPVKVPLPGPYLLTRALWVPALARPAYGSKEELSEDVVRVLRREIEDLIAEGADCIQLDEPVLTEVVFAPKATRTFMCASLAERGDPAEELEFAVGLVNRVLDGLRGPIFALHVCRGNWSRDETTLLRGDYAPLAPYLERVRADQLVLEYATDRAGELRRFGDKALGLGVVNPRTDEVESEEDIARSIRAALTLYPPDRLFLNPDCGFGTFSLVPMNRREVAERKLRAMVGAARQVRLELAAGRGESRGAGPQAGPGVREAPGA